MVHLFQAGIALEQPIEYETIEQVPDCFLDDIGTLCKTADDVALLPPSTEGSPGVSQGSPCASGRPPSPYRLAGLSVVASSPLVLIPDGFDGVCELLGMANTIRGVGGFDGPVSSDLLGADRRDVTVERVTKRPTATVGLEILAVDVVRAEESLRGRGSRR